PEDANTPRAEEPESDGAGTGDPLKNETNSFTVRQALHHSAFWKIAFVIATVALVGTGLMFHQVSILATRGVSRSMALGSLGIQACAATFSTLLAGYLMDRVHARFVLATSMLLEVLAILLLLHFPGPSWVFLYATLMGLHGGIIRSAGSIVWINFFGRKYQGAIQGVA
ncbi:MAG: MFS transporter, partial [Fuerstiella sp.]|nr:MFS transporter [Fuerstiella sp.]